MHKPIKYYAAPWGGWLIVISALSTALCLAIGISVARENLWLSACLVAVVFGCALFTIRGYTITPQTLLVHRLLWATTVPLAGLQSAETLPRGVSFRGIRIGNGGFFSFSGWSYVPGRGFFRVFVTDPNRKVLLNFPNRRVVVSPAMPNEFINDLRIAGYAPNSHQD